MNKLELGPFKVSGSTTVITVAIIIILAMFLIYLYAYQNPSIAGGLLGYTDSSPEKENRHVNEESLPTTNSSDMHILVNSDIYQALLIKHELSSQLIDSPFIDLTTRNNLRILNVFLRPLINPSDFPIDSNTAKKIIVHLQREYNMKNIDGILGERTFVRFLEEISIIGRV